MGGLLIFFMKNLSRISTALLGLMFLVSAFAKAWDAEAFAQMLLLYGSKLFGIGAPIIIMIEAILGMSLLLRIYPRWMAASADIFLIAVSAIFSYGVLAKGIEDCGCFGALSRLYTGAPWMTFVRNAVFLVISIPALRYRADEDGFCWPKALATVVVASMACFAAGLSMRKSFELPKWSSVQKDNWEQTMTKLNAIYPFSADSTYVVYLFSFSCAYCQNSFANVEQYQQFGLMDKVLGIAIEDEEQQERFCRIYRPEIPILTIPHDQMSDMTGSLPIAIYIKDGKIKDVEGGGVTSPGIFLK